MIRIQTYNSTPRRIQTGGINPGNQPALRTVSGRAEDRTLAAMLQSGLKLTDIAVKEYVSNETARVSQSLQQMNAELAAERERYMRENQGQNALNAGEHFENFARELAEKHLADGKFQGRFAQEFVQQAAGTALHFTEQGRSYAGQQRAAWLESRTKGEISDFLNQVAQNYDNKDWIEFNLNNLTHRINEMRPGLDNRALLDDVRKDAAEGVIDGFLAAGRVGDARRALAQYRDMLGDRANAVKVRIDASADALQAKAEAQRKKAEKAVEEAAIKDATNNILTGVEDYPSLEEQREAAFAHVDSIEDSEVREKVRTEIRQEMAWRETRQDATAAREKRQFRELARNQEWTPRQASAMLDQATDMSDKARDDLRKDFDGKAERKTPANKAALAELRILLDRGAERGGIDPKDADSIDAYIERHALTYEQGIKAHEYAEQGGAAGELTQAQVNRVYKMLFPKKKSSTIPGDLFDLVADELKRSAPGKAVTDAEVRQVMSRLYLEGESDGSGWIDDTESYAEALRHNRDTAWEIHVPEEDEKRISALLEDAEVRPTPKRIRAWYRHEKGFAE